METEEITRNYELVVEDSNVKYSPFGFGTIFTNIEDLFTDKLISTDKNLINYFREIQHIYHVDGEEFEYVKLTSILKNNKSIFQIHLKQI